MRCKEGWIDVGIEIAECYQLKNEKRRMCRAYRNLNDRIFPPGKPSAEAEIRDTRVLFSI